MKCIFYPPCLCVDSIDILNIFSCLVCNWLQHLHIDSKDTENWIKSSIRNLLISNSGYLVKFFSFFPHLCLETVFPLKLTQIYYKNMNIFFLENWQFNNRLTLCLLHTHLAWNAILTIWQNMKISRIQKFQIFNSLMNQDKFESTS